MDALVRIAIVTILPTENISDLELEVELRTRLMSSSFAIDHISIIH